MPTEHIERAPCPEMIRRPPAPRSSGALECRRSLVSSASALAFQLVALYCVKPKGSWHSRETQREPPLTDGKQMPEGKWLPQRPRRCPVSCELCLLTPAFVDNCACDGSVLCLNKQAFTHSQQPHHFLNGGGSCCQHFLAFLKSHAPVLCVAVGRKGSGTGHAGRAQKCAIQGETRPLALPVAFVLVLSL